MNNMIRHDHRAYDQIRSVKVSYNCFGYAPGNVFFEQDNTKVLCSVSMQKGVPPFLKGTRTGWLTAEYAMLPAATLSRVARESVLLKRNYRSVEISRMIGRSLRTIIDLNSFGEQTIMIDCDVLQADGGTRCASLTGAFLALKMAEQKWLLDGLLRKSIIKDSLAAVSVGIVAGCPLLDLDYQEDSKADVDFNVVLTSTEKVIEIQGASEKSPISWQLFDQLRDLASHGIKQLFKNCLSIESPTLKKKLKQKLPLFSLQRRNENISGS